MAKIIGDYTGKTWNDALVLPGESIDDKKFTPEDVDISTNLAGVDLGVPFLVAAMRSIVGNDMVLAAGKKQMMAVAPRGLTIEKEVGIVRYVKDHAVKKGDIESEHRPTRVYDFDTLGTSIRESKRTGHSNIPVVTYKSDFVGVFQYRPAKHDKMDVTTPIIDVMQPYRRDGEGIHTCRSIMTDEEIKRYLTEFDLRLVPVVDDIGRLDRLVFLQKSDAYKVGAAIDTHEGWERRAEKLIEAGADMIFIDTSDAHKPFTKDVVVKYKSWGKGLPPICAGNIVTPDAFLYLVEAGADVVKLGMGPGSICSTNEELGVGAPPLWSLIEVAKRRDEYYRETKTYIPLIADGGLNGMKNVVVALPFCEAIMGGKLFGCFYESEGDRLGRDGNVYSRNSIQEEDIVEIKIFGEASKEALRITGDMRRYSTPLSRGDTTTFQGVSGWISYKGKFKPGTENYTIALKEAMYHAGARNLQEYRDKAILIMLSEGAKETTRPHGIKIKGE